MEKKRTPKRFRSKRNKRKYFNSFHCMENSNMTKQSLTKPKVLKRALNSDVKSCTPEMIDRVEAFRKLRNKAEKTNDISGFYVDLLMDLYPKLEEEQGPLNPETIYTIQFIELELKVLHKRIGPEVFDDFDNVVTGTNEAKSKTENKSEMENNTMTTENKATVKTDNDRLLGGNITSAISGGLTGALTSVAIDFVFGTDQTTAEMAIDAGISAAIGAASSYAVSRLCDMDDSSYLANSAVGAGVGFGTAASFRSIEASLKNNGGAVDLIQPNFESVTE